MIAKIGAGQRVGGLVAYLFGAGKAEEHQDQHVVAGSANKWVGATPADRADLTAWLQQYDRRGQGQGRPPGRVWHCSLSIRHSDKPLTDAQWQEAAERVMERVGLGGENAAGGGVRWVGVRHGLSANGNDHIHIAALLVDAEGTPRIPYRDFLAARDVCRELESQWGLRATSPANGTANVNASRAEQERGKRENTNGESNREVPVRYRLESEVRAAAASTTNFDEMSTVLAERGITAEPVHVSESGKAFGAVYSDPTYTDAAGEPIGFSGTKLAADLTLPKLEARWAVIKAAAPGGSGDFASLAGDRQAMDEAIEQVEAALAAAADQIQAGEPGAAASMSAASDHLAVSARVFEPNGSGPLHEAARHAAQAGRELGGKIPAGGPVSGGIRASSIAMFAARHGADKGGRDMLRMYQVTMRLMDAQADLRRTQHRRRQAAAARSCRKSLNASEQGELQAQLAGGPRRPRPGQQLATHKNERSSAAKKRRDQAKNQGGGRRL